MHRGIFLFAVVMSVSCAPIARKQHVQSSWKTSTDKPEEKKEAEATDAALQTEPVQVVQAEPEPEPEPEPVLPESQFVSADPEPDRTPIVAEKEQADETPSIPVRQETEVTTVAVAEPEPEPEPAPEPELTAAGDLSAFSGEEIRALKRSSRKFRSVLNRHDRCQKAAEKKVDSYMRVKKSIDRLSQNPGKNRQRLKRLEKRERRIEQAINKKYSACAEIEEQAADMLRARAAQI